MRPDQPLLCLRPNVKPSFAGYYYCGLVPMISNLLRLVPDEPTEPSPEDIFSSALSTLFPDELVVQHGDVTTTIVYRSTQYGDLNLRCADVLGEEDRGKFAHYLWNSGVLMAEFVGGRGAGEAVVNDDDFGQRTFANGHSWWLTEDEELIWKARGHQVLELGAGQWH
jgi:nicotinamide N-methyltransferase